jgi:acylphosphatase
MSGAEACRRFWVSGRVQGVYFRASAREKARALGLHGWIANLPDGRVEAVARGAADALEAFATWLAEGPPQAEVSGVASEVVEIETPPGFEVR